MLCPEKSEPMEDLIIIAVIALIVGLAAGYIYRAKKRGVKCIGCPAAGSSGKGGCGGNCAGCGCGCGADSGK